MSEGRIEGTHDLGWGWGIVIVDPCDHVTDRMCEVCSAVANGVTREVKHRTVGGRGVVGRLRGRNAG